VRGDPAEYSSRPAAPTLRVRRGPLQTPPVAQDPLRLPIALLSPRSPPHGPGNSKACAASQGPP